MNKIVTGVASALIVVGLAVIAGAFVKLPSAPVQKIVRPSEVADFSQVTVKIVTSAKNGGGTGVILSGKIILTNKHICDAIQNGGYVVQGSREYKITSYKPYPKHDLCMVATSHDFGVGVKVADRSAQIYSGATISGHPGLLPLTVTVGHYSGHQVVTLIVDIKPCPEVPEEKDVPVCMFLGGIPVEKSFDAQLVTATIKPGSSGSPVFNQNGELTNLAFASSSPMLDYALTVPQSYVSDFYYNNMLYHWYTPKTNAKHKNLFLTAIQRINEGCINIQNHSGDVQVICRKYAFFKPKFKN